MKTEKLFILLFVLGRSNREIDKNIEEKTDTILCLISEIIKLNRKNSFNFDSCIRNRLLIITAKDLARKESLSGMSPTEGGKSLEILILQTAAFW